MERGKTLAEARAAKAEALKRFSDSPNVAGIGIAMGPGGYGVKINLVRESDVDLPTEINDVPVVVEVVGQARKRSL